MHAWLSRLRHDLVKRAVWAARDLREASREPGEAELLQLRRGLFDLRDEDGRVSAATALWERLRADAPALPPAALDAFGAAVRRAEQAVSGLAANPRSWPAVLDAVLHIEQAFADLARTLEQE
jgi:hypothetical protein